MKVKVKFYGRFRKLFGSEEKEIEAESGTTARSLVETLCVSQECGTIYSTSRASHDAAWKS